MSAQAGSLVVAVNYVDDPVTAQFDLIDAVQVKPVPWSVIQTTYRAR